MSSFQETQRGKEKSGADDWTLTQEQRASSQGPADLDVMDVHVLAGNVLHRNLLCNLERNESISPSLIARQQIQESVCVCVLLHLHLKAGFAFIDSIGGLASRPQVGETLHRQRRGTVTIPGHLKVQVAVVYRENPCENHHL